MADENKRIEDEVLEELRNWATPKLPQIMADADDAYGLQCLDVSQFDSHKQYYQYLRDRNQALRSYDLVIKDLAQFKGGACHPRGGNTQYEKKEADEIVTAYKDLMKLAQKGTKKSKFSIVQ